MPDEVVVVGRRVQTAQPGTPHSQPSSQEPRESSIEAIPIGSRVRTQYTVSEGGDGGWYYGNLVARDHPRVGECVVKYDDGDTWEGPICYVQTLPDWLIGVDTSVNGCNRRVSASLHTMHLQFFALMLVGGLSVLTNSFIYFGLSGLVGEVGLWYQLPLCPNRTATTPPRFDLRLAPECADCDLREAALPGYACPAEAAGPSPPAIISLERLDGFKPGSTYAPTLLLGSGDFGLVSLSLKDARGDELIPDLTLQLGPTSAFPWGEDAGGGVPAGEGRPARGLRDSVGDLVPELRIAEAAGVEADAARRPAARRLLKAGGYGYGHPGGGVGGLAGSEGRKTYGAGRWGSASGSASTVTPRRVHAYGSPGYGGLHAWRGSYYYGAASVAAGTHLMVLSQGHFYGRHPNAYGSCNGTRSRIECGESSSFRADQSMDRYELANDSFVAPADFRRWPLRLTVRRATIYPGNAGGSAAAARRLASGSPPSRECLVSFSTNDGSAAYERLDLLSSLSYWLLLAIMLLPMVLLFAPALLLWLARQLSECGMALRGMCCLRSRRSYRRLEEGREL